MEPRACPVLPCRVSTPERETLLSTNIGIAPCPPGYYFAKFLFLHVVSCIPGGRSLACPVLPCRASSAEGRHSRAQILESLRAPRYVLAKFLFLKAVTCFA